MRKYELVVLLHPDLEIDLAAPIKRCEDILIEVGAKNLKREDWGKRKLAYQITRQHYAIYIFFRFELQPAKLSRLDTLLRLNGEVLRYLVVQQEDEAVLAVKAETKNEAKASQSSVQAAEPATASNKAKQTVGVSD